MSGVQAITTADQLLRDARELGRCELVRGELRMMSPAGGRHGDVALTLAYHVKRHVLEHGLGTVYAAETGFILERNPDTVRAPDVAFIGRDRVAEADTPMFIPIPPDFVAEVLSPEDRASAVAEKVQWWLDHGVKLVWVADPRTQTVTVHLPGGAAHRYSSGETINGGEVLPGLAVAVSDLFA